MGTYTFALLEVSKETWDEIAEALKAAQYDVFHELPESKGVIDMHGIGLVNKGDKDNLPKDEVLYERKQYTQTELLTYLEEFGNYILENVRLHDCGKRLRKDFVEEWFERKVSNPEVLLEPIAQKANDPRVLVNGKPIPVDFRILAEETYQNFLELQQYKKEREEKDKEDQSYHGNPLNQH